MHTCRLGRTRTAGSAVIPRENLYTQQIWEIFKHSRITSGKKLTGEGPISYSSTPVIKSMETDLWMQTRLASKDMLRENCSNWLAGISQRRETTR